MDDAKTEEVNPTPAQLAEIEENKKPFLDKFKDLVDEAADRQRHGTTLNPTFVNAMRALYDEAENGPPAMRAKVPMPSHAPALTAAALQVRADRAAKRASDQKALDDAKAALAQDGLDE